MHHHPMSTRHALKFDFLSKVQQQRVMKKLEKKAREYSKQKLNNAPSEEAEIYSWHRRVRLSREARALHLLRAFLKGTPYKVVEQSNTAHTIPPLNCLIYYTSDDKLAIKYADDLNKWVNT